MYGEPDDVRLTDEIRSLIDEETFNRIESGDVCVFIFTEPDEGSENRVLIYKTTPFAGDALEEASLGGELGTYSGVVYHIGLDYPRVRVQRHRNMPACAVYYQMDYNPDRGFWYLKDSTRVLHRERGI